MSEIILTAIISIFVWQTLTVLIDVVSGSDELAIAFMILPYTVISVLYMFLYEKIYIQFYMSKTWSLYTFKCEKTTYQFYMKNKLYKKYFKPSDNITITKEHFKSIPSNFYTLTEKALNDKKDFRRKSIEEFLK